MAQFDAFDDGVAAGGPVVGSTLAGTSELSCSPVETEANRDQHPRADGDDCFCRGSWQ